MTSQQAQVEETNSHIELDREIRRYVLGYARKRLPVHTDEIETALNETRAFESRWTREPVIGCSLESLLQLTIALEILAGEQKPRRSKPQQIIKTVEERTAVVSARVQIAALNAKLLAVADPEAVKLIEQKLASAQSQYSEIQNLTAETFEASEKRKYKLIKSIEAMRVGLMSCNPDARQVIWRDLDRIFVALDKL